MIFLSYLWINVGNINLEIRYEIILFEELEANWNFTGCQEPQFMIVLIQLILYQLIKLFLDNKMSIFVK